MGTIASAASNFGLSATGTAVSTNVEMVGSIGEKNNSHSFSDSDIAYSFSVTSTGASDVATLNLADGVTAQTTGTPNIEDSGTDFEGQTLSTATRIHAALIVFNDVVSGSISVSGKLSAIGEEDGQALLLSIPNGSTTLTDIILTFDGVGQKATITIISKT